MKRDFTLLFLLLVFLGFRPKAQTVGVLEYTDDVQPGYVLFAPLSTGDVYLIDECGSVINMWEVDGTAGLMGRLADDGSLIYTRRAGSNVFSGGGIGGVLVCHDWEGQLKWSISMASDTFHHHHDFHILPNGNILLNGWHLITEERAVKAGRVDYPNGGLFAEKLLELHVDEMGNYQIVWEWSFWDHLIQNADIEADNFGKPIDFPERFDVNFNNGLPSSFSDWLHVNSVDYNEELDQIVINCRNWNEFWVIDHSTTTQEARGSTGGNSGMGGDVLYRWGNPSSYGAGVFEDRQLYSQHDANWIDSDAPGVGSFMVFNNGLARPEGLYSTIDVITPEIIDGVYQKEESTFLPEFSEELYGGPLGSEQFIFSGRLSGSQQLRNGNTLICIGQTGQFVEINEEKEVVWRYQNPAGNIILTQGQEPTTSHGVFQAIKYYKDFVGFADKDLTPGDKIEINPIDNCDFTISTKEEEEKGKVRVRNTLVVDNLIVENPNLLSYDLVVYSLTGRRIYSCQATEANTLIDLSMITSGVYVVHISEAGQESHYTKIIKANE